MRRIAVLVAVVLCTLGAAAQETFFSESIEVRVLNVDVIVTDKKGAPVTGLTKDDFEVLENGTAREITNFSEFRATPAAAAPNATQAPPLAPTDSRPRRIVIFLDEASLRSNTRNRVLPPIKSFVRKTLRRGDTAMIALWKPGLQIALPMTADVAAFEAKLDAIAQTATMGRLAASEDHDMQMRIRTGATDMTQVGPRGSVSRPPISDGIGTAQTIATKAMHEQHEKVEAMKSVLASLRGVDGRKVFVFLTESLTDIPGRDAFEYLERIKDLYEGGSSYVASAVMAQYRDQTLVPSLTEAANSSSVSLYPIDAAGLGRDNEVLSAENLAGQAIGVTSIRTSSDQRLHVLHEIAAATGGMATTATDNFALTFDTIANDLTSYYSLGYRAEGDKQDQTRALSVKLKKKGYTIRTRQSLVEKSINSEMGDAVAANLFYPVEKNELKIAMTAGAKTAVDTEHASVPVELKIPTASLTLLPEGKELTGKFSTYAAFVRDDGAVSQVKVQTHALRFPAESLARRKEVTVKLDVMIDNSVTGLSVGVMDDVAHTTGFATVTLTPK
ncbi:MAG TPA: VWA domain-containing protein [Thermoanaerobaculia bacterium]|nr:VWA domain-containing protein [Thermoanaerobaculia bacterium]